MSVSFEGDFPDMQPLSRVRQDAHVHFGRDDTISSRPKLAIKIAECITDWAGIESMLALSVGMLLQSQAGTALAIYGSVESRAAQLRMLRAAAESKFPPPVLDLFSAILDGSIIPCMKIRDKLAHWCWGYSDQLPDDLLLMHPNNKTLAHYSALSKPVDINRDDVFVVTEKYLTGVRKQIKDAQDYYTGFVTSHDASIHEIRRTHIFAKLLKVPLIRKGVDRRMASREKLRGVPPLLPEEWHGETP
jgi:hypothetical protein